MKYFYFVVTVELDRNENIFSDGKKEPSMGRFSYVERASDSTNLVHHFGCIQGLKSVNIFETKKEAESRAEAWNESYKKNGTYYFQKVQN